jgi:large subunit ribosomal protein L7/L12
MAAAEENAGPSYAIAAVVVAIAAAALVYFHCHSDSDGSAATAAAALSDLSAEMTRLSAEMTREMARLSGEIARMKSTPQSQVVSQSGSETTAAPVQDQLEFTVMLADYGSNKVHVIKVVREITGLDLLEAKALVDNAPKPVKEGCTKEDAEKYKRQLENAGAKAEIM